ncbi:helix-turn-helix transcriptional regulator [Sporichthya brevicatena]|uniref:Helix-turn-helix transcriptional regulator n=1 Tax=Sporichthya brevicatena TaxID=171442 RepID=A0ABP3RCV6_9ACTN
MQSTAVSTRGTLHTEVPTLAAYLYELKQVTGAEITFGGTRAGEGSPAVLSTFVGTKTEALRGVQVELGRGLGGKAMAVGRPIHVRDYSTARGITHDYDAAVKKEGLHAILAVPILSRAGASGVIYAGLRRPELISERMMDRAVAVARRMEYEAAVTAEVNRRLAELTSAMQAPAPGADQRLRDVHAELGLIRSTATGTTRQLIDDLMHRLAGTLRTSGQEEEADRVVTLTPRELDVITQVAIGCSNAEAGERLGVGESTVKSYLHAAMRKLGARNRVEAVTAARRAGLIP